MMNQSEYYVPKNLLSALHMIEHTTKHVNINQFYVKEKLEEKTQSIIPVSLNKEEVNRSTRRVYRRQLSGKGGKDYTL